MKKDPVIEKLIHHDRELAEIKLSMKSRFHELVGMLGEVLITVKRLDQERVSDSFRSFSVSGQLDPR